MPQTPHRKKKTVLVTGGAGFIGSEIVRQLGDLQKYRIIVVDDFSTGHKSHIKGVDCIILKKNILHLSVNDMQDVAYVIHTAAKASIPESFQKEKEYEEINVKGTKHLLEISLQAGVQKFIFSSSGSVYGNSNALSIKEQDRIEPASPYAKQKHKAELLCKEYSEKGLQCVVLRYFNVYGASQDMNHINASVIMKFATCIKEGKPLTIFGDGSQTRDYIHVNDVAKANVLALKKKTGLYNVFNIGTGHSTSVNEIALLLTNSTYSIVYKEKRNGDVLHAKADISYAQKILGFKAKITLPQGIEEMKGFIQGNRQDYRMFDKVKETQFAIIN